ncbi:MAG TPA: hypothetical protein VF256_10810 [Streptosporangiaceae bacterium]
MSTAPPAEAPATLAAHPHHGWAARPQQAPNCPQGAPAIVAGGAGRCGQDAGTGIGLRVPGITSGVEHLLALAAAVLLGTGFVLQHRTA